MNQTEHAARSFPWTFVVLTYGLSWSIWVAGWLLSGKPIESGASGAVRGCKQSQSVAAGFHSGSVRMASLCRCFATFSHRLAHSDGTVWICANA